jgi:hypothetical protein
LRECGDRKAGDLGDLCWLNEFLFHLISCLLITLQY